MNRRLDMFDEGLILVDAIRALHGDVIHRDFYTPYGPAANYVLAALFALDDHWFVIGRLYGVATMAGVVAAVFGVLVRQTRLWVALTFTAACGLWMLATPYYLYPVFPSLLLALIGSAVLLRWFERSGGVRLFLAGTTAGVTALFRYDVGFFLLAAHCAAIAVDMWSVRAVERRSGALLRAGLVYGAGAAAPFLPFAIWYLSVAPLSAFVADIIDYPLHHYVAMRALPFPRPGAVLRDIGLVGIYLPILAVALGAAALILTRRAAVVRPLERPDRQRQRLLLVFTLLAAVFYYKGMVRVSTLHMLMSIVPSLPVLAILVDTAWSRPGRGRLVAGLLLVCAICPPAYAAARQTRAAWRDGGTPLSMLLRQTKTVAADDACPAPATTALALQTPQYQRVSDYLRYLSRPDETIFVGLNRHDRIFINSISLYLSTNRRPATHWHQFDPGLQTRADIQPLIIADLIRNRTRWVIRDASFNDIAEPNLSRRSSGVHLLDRFIARHYRRVATFGRVEVWLINGARVPPPSSWPDCLARSTESAPYR